MKINFVSLNQVKIQLGRQIILSASDFFIDQGDMVAVVGANGSGKTTLLKALCGILLPSTGTIQIANNSYSNPQQATQIRKILGFAPDNPPLYAQDTVQSYLQFIAELKQIPRNEITARITHMCEVFALHEYRDKYIHTLSKGTQQRLNLAQALIHNPRLVILDEPTNALDPEQVQALLQYLHKLRTQDVTIIIASHDYTDLIPQCDYMLKLKQGTLEKILLPLRITEDVTTYDHVNHTT